MILPVQCWITRKKRTMGIRKPRSFFKKLPIELRSKIFDKLCVKDQSRAMCVSTSWRNEILYTTLPKEVPQQPLVNLHQTPFQDLNLQQLIDLLDWCSRVLRTTVRATDIVDTCNGLLLFCNANGGALNLTHGVFYYYVVNYFTKQCVAVLKPSAQTSFVYSYATLIYDPKESWFFKIMRFKGRRSVDVFSSENSEWTTMSLCLPEYIGTSCLTKQCVYLNGCVYRLSSSGHLVKIRVDPQENVSEQAEIITLTSDCVFENCQWALSLKGGKIFFAASRGMNFMVYELVESVTMGVTSYSWCNITRIKDPRLWELNTNGTLLPYHPYYNVAVYDSREFLLFYVSIGDYNNIIELEQVPYNEILYDYLSCCSRSPLLECSIPFICYFESSRVCQRISIPP